MRTLAPIAVLLSAGCVIMMTEEAPDSGPLIVYLDAGGGGGGGGGGGLGGGGNLDGSVGWGKGADGGPRRGFPGSGQDGDPGTALILFFRVDRGTANLAAAEEAMIKTLVAALEASQLVVSYVVAIDLYAGTTVLWQTFLHIEPGVTLADSLRNRAAVIDSVPAVCTTQGPMDFGRVSGLRTRAAMIAVVEHGARPVAVACDVLAASAAADPTLWLSYPIPRAQLRYLFISTPEGEQLAQMQSACLAMQGFPAAALDALSPSALFFDPIAQRIDQAQPQLANRIDLCEALGSTWPAHAAQIANAWSAVLQLQP